MSFSTMVEFVQLTNAIEDSLREVRDSWDCTDPYKQNLVHEMEVMLLQKYKEANERAFALGLIKPII